LVDQIDNMGRKKRLIELPTSCLSYSQVSLWLSSPTRYKKIFFDQDEGARFMNDAMRYGSWVADAMENDEETGDLMTDMAIAQLVKYDVRDEEMEAVLHTKDGDIKILSHPDTFDSKTKALREYKTGMVKWTQKKADNWFQLKFYAMLVFIKYNVVPPSCFLDWIETFKDDDGEIKPTGNVFTFKVNITMGDIINTLATVSRVAKEIEAEWLVYEKPVTPFTKWIQ